MLATETLQLSREPLAVPDWLNNLVHPANDPVDPAVGAQLRRRRQVRPLDIRQVELPRVAEDPVGRELGHGLLVDISLEPASRAQALEELHVGLVVLAEGHKLRVHDDHARPRRQPVLAKDLGVLLLHLVVEPAHEAEYVERRAEHADAQVVVAREVFVVVHLSQRLQQEPELLPVVQVQRLEAHGALVVGVAVHLEREVRQHAQVARAAAHPGVELLRVALARDLALLARVVDDLQRPDVVPEEPEAAAQLAVPARLRVPADVHGCALPVRHEGLVLPEERVELAQAPAHAGVDVALVVLLEVGQVVGPLECVAEIQQDVVLAGG